MLYSQSGKISQRRAGMTKTITRVLMALSGIIIVIGVILMYQTIQDSNDPDAITVYIKKGEIETIEFADLSLIPGDECQYHIKIKGTITKSCDVVLNFVKKGGHTLENFAYVRILYNDEVLYDDLLASAFESQGINILVDFSQKTNTDLRIVYYLPETVGNEIKNAEALFELQISASNE
jgi:hypothetical protein